MVCTLMLEDAQNMNYAIRSLRQEGFERTEQETLTANTYTVQADTLTIVW